MGPEFHSCILDSLDTVTVWNKLCASCEKFWDLACCRRIMDALALIFFADVDWARSKTDRMSTTS